MGYGSRAMSLLREYYSGEHLSLEENIITPETAKKEEEDANTQQIISMITY